MADDDKIRKIEMHRAMHPLMGDRFELNGKAVMCVGVEHPRGADFAVIHYQAI